jgi:hypothetical protein
MNQKTSVLKRFLMGAPALRSQRELTTRAERFCLPITGCGQSLTAKTIPPSPQQTCTHAAVPSTPAAGYSADRTALSPNETAASHPVAAIVASGTAQAIGHLPLV